MKKLIIILAVFTSTSVCCQTTDTTSIELKIAKAFIEAMNDPDIEAMRAFTLNYRTEKALARTPIEKRLESYKDFKEKMGILEIGSIDKLEPGSIKLFVYAAERDTWFKMGFKTENDRLESLTMMPARDPNKSGKHTNIEEQLQKIVTDGLAPGVALVTISNGKISKSSAYGVRNTVTNEPVKMNDPFHLGSVTKSFTASLIGKLIDQGKISIDAKLGDLFPFEIHEKISIRDHQKCDGT